jgi:hypothetical protein
MNDECSKCGLELRKSNKLTVPKGQKGSSLQKSVQNNQFLVSSEAKSDEELHHFLVLYNLRY